MSAVLDRDTAEDFAVSCSRRQATFSSETTRFVMRPTALGRIFSFFVSRSTAPRRRKMAAGTLRWGGGGAESASRLVELADAVKHFEWRLG
jgi:hypothetical protein